MNLSLDSNLGFDPCSYPVSNATAVGFNNGYSTAINQYTFLSFALFIIVLAQYSIRILVSILNKRDDIKYVRLIQILKEIDKGLLLPELAIAFCFVYYALGLPAFLIG